MLCKINAKAAGGNMGVHVRLRRLDGAAVSNVVVHYVAELRLQILQCCGPLGAGGLKGFCHLFTGSGEGGHPYCGTY